MTWKECNSGAHGLLHQYLYLRPLKVLHTESKLMHALTILRINWLKMGRCRLSLVWLVVLSPVLLALVYEQVQLSKHGSNEAALHFNYNIPLAVAPALELVLKLSALPVQLAAYIVLSAALLPPPKVAVD
jgi:hypothetical protein